MTKTNNQKTSVENLTDLSFKKKIKLHKFRIMKQDQ